ncbi:hypothetical protein SAMN02745866_01304 [Alteromonadaceae bacterium Bs31]|nr:hypothetical protein SAMN02745866_01304 [Alteromonadaceae bacterium Bs31]
MTMNTRTPNTRLLFVAMALIASSGNSFAIHHPASDEPRPAAYGQALDSSLVQSNLLIAQAKREISKSQAASAAQSKYGGKVINVSRKGSSYRVKLLLESGKVKIVTVDASTGKAR